MASCLQPAAQAPGCAHARILQYGARAEYIARAIRDKSRAPVDPVHDLAKGKGCVVSVGELVRNYLRMMRSTAFVPTFVIDILASCTASVVKGIEYVFDKDVREKYARDLKLGPEHSVEALGAWIGGLFRAMVPGMALDIMQVMVKQLCTLIAGTGLVACGLLSKCLEIISKGPGRVLVVGLLLCLAAPLMAIMSKMVDRFHQDGEHAHANDPRKNSAEISALFSVAFDSARLFAGQCVHNLVGIGGGCLSGLPGLLAGIVTAWVLSACGTIGKEEWRKADGKKSFSVKDVVAATKLALGLTQRAVEPPTWNMDILLQGQVGVYAPDMVCAITRDMLVEPCVLEEHLFERKAVERWIRENHSNPMTRNAAYIGDIQPCCEMRDLVLEFAREFNLNVVHL